MEIHHKIKPPHGWREFLFEIGTIVLGVLLALGAEQTVEAMHRAHLVEEAEAAMRIEMLTDDGPQAYVRAASATCFTTQLGAMRKALEAGVDRKAFYEMTLQYAPPWRSWDSQAWKSTVASNVGGYMGAKRLNAWGTLYGVIPNMDIVASEERRDDVLLQGGRRSPGKMSDAETDELLKVVDRLTFENRALAGLSLGVLDGMGKVNAPLSVADQRSLLAQSRQSFGACVQPPDLRLWNTIGQATDRRKMKLPF